MTKIKCRPTVLFLIFVLQLLLLSGCGLSKPEQKSENAVEVVGKCQRTDKKRLKLF
ncbi:MAG: hypothetical protein HDR01_09940 [Lachnospiraceae bacterium]|nr:hypothetical protein [Lachnospiraceae bacterium]